MSKRVLYIVIAVLALVILWLLFVPSSDEPTVKVEERDSSVIDADIANSEETSETTKNDDQLEDDLVTLEGTYIGLADGKDEFLGSFKYALVDDGTEVIRVDLRSIVGYDVTGLEEELQLSPGQSVSVKGYLENGEFVATVIK